MNIISDKQKTTGDIMNYLCALPGIKDTAQRETEFKGYFAEYEKAVRSHNDLSSIPDDKVKMKLIDNLVYLAGYCSDAVCNCVEELTGKTLLIVHAEQQDKQRSIDVKEYKERRTVMDLIIEAERGIIAGVYTNSHENFKVRIIDEDDKHDDERRHEYHAIKKLINSGAVQDILYGDSETEEIPLNKLPELYSRAFLLIRDPLLST